MVTPVGGPGAGPAGGAGMAPTGRADSGPISVVIPAHNEEAVLGSCLRRLLEDAKPGEFEVVVVPNGCTDGTAAVARSFAGVTVLELAASSKATALNAGDQAATGFPRIYLDADIQLSTTDARALAAALQPPGANPPPERTTLGGISDRPTPLAVAPRRVVLTTGRPLLVRAYYAINCRLPVFRDALIGRGVIAVSRAGRKRFERFPETFADDLYLDSIFRVGERIEVASARAASESPMRTRDLLRRLARVRAGNAALRTMDGRAHPSSGGSWLFHVVLPRPWLLPAAVCYVALTLLAEASARRTPAGTTWGRDESSRTMAGGGTR
ncbi:glycosyltransferase family 2 protein [Micromonospora sp. NPDC003197]